MPRSLDSNTAAELTSNVVRPAFFVSIAFANETIYAWTGTGSFINPYDGNTYTGVGTFGTISSVQESSDVQAQGITLKLSGIPTNLLDDSLSDVQFGQLARVYLGFLNSSGTLVGAPIPAFIGLVDQPAIDINTDTVTISISVESRLADMQRAPGGRLTDQDQRSRYPNDGSLRWVQYIQNMHLGWT
jgi:hypothetical protein